MSESVETFSLDVWKEQGKNRITQIEELLESAHHSIDELKKSIDALEREKLELLSALGGVTKLNPKSPVRKKKVIIRPILLEKLIFSSGPVSTMDLIDYVREEKPLASTKSIKISLGRLVKDHPNISETDNGVVFHKDEEVVVENAS
jgi:hypothetical protein